jgi:glycosyltransferase involved in cell wall biosynthesis
MKLLYIGCNDTFSRHELGFIAALNSLGSIDVIVLGQKFNVRRINVASDNGKHVLTFYEVPAKNLQCVHYCVDIIKRFFRVNDYDVIFVTPRLPTLVARFLRNSSQQTILRLWSIRASKLKDNLAFGAYEDIIVYIPSILANFFYILGSSYAVAVDHATYLFALKAYSVLTHKIAKLYPPYGFILEKREDNNAQRVLDVVECSDYVLGFTILSKRGSYLKFEAKPHAVVLYRLAKKTPVDIVVAGSTYEDWKHVFPSFKPPKNLHIVGKGFGDDVVAELYRKSRVVISPITNRNISNRLLEALFHGKPTVTTDIAKCIHPELVHGEHVYMSTWNNIVEDAVKLLKDEEILRTLGTGARRAYDVFFSARRNAEFIKGLIFSKSSI